jgi:hypothetical protein
MRRASSSLLKTLVGSLASVVRSSNLAAEVDRRAVDVRGPRGGVDVQFADVDVAAGDSSTVRRATASMTARRIR